MDQKVVNTSPNTSSQVMNVRKSLDRMGGDEALLKDLATFFLEDSVELLQQLDASLEAGDAKSAARSAHSISGLSANFTAESCTLLAKSIEELCLRSDLESAQHALPSLKFEVERLVAAIRQEIL